VLTDRSSVELPEDGERVALVCAECGRENPSDAAGWRAYLDDDGKAVTFCPECAAREFSG
jgi:hypothetical protein